MKLNPLVLMRRDFDGTGVVFDPERNKAVTLNRTGVVIWQALEQGLSEAEAVREVVSRFQVDEAAAARDAAAFLAVLREKGFLEEQEN